MKTHKLSLLSFALATALAVAGCSGGSGGDGYGDNQVQPPPPAPTPTPPPPKPESFTDWSIDGVFAKEATGTPEIMDELVWNFDGNEDEHAYDRVLPPPPPEETTPVETT